MRVSTMKETATNSTEVLLMASRIMVVGPAAIDMCGWVPFKYNASKYLPAGFVARAYTTKQSDNVLALTELLEKEFKM